MNRPLRRGATVAASVCLLCAWPLAYVGAQPLPDGTYASRQRVSSVAKMPPQGRMARVATTSLVLHSVERREAEIRVRSRFCSVRQDPLGPVRTEMPVGFVTAIPEWISQARVWGPAEGPWSVEVAERPLLIGTRLEDDLEDPLPRKKDDPRVTDPDEDGRPGVTVKVSGMIGGEVYVAQRLVRGLTGKMTPDGRMSGRVTGASEQVILGASSAVLQAFTPRFEPDPDAARSVFDWVPVPNGTSCDELNQTEATLFGDG